MNNVILEKSGKIAKIIINRPKVLNALNSETLDEILEAVRDVESDESVRVVIVTGSGEKAFVAGADISEMVKIGSVEGYEFAKKGQNTFQAIEDAKKFYIAAVNGFALGGGCELAMACDMRIASENAKMGLPEVTLGVIPAFGGTQRLPKLVGLGKAKELMATAAMLTAFEAEKWGLVNHVVKLENLLDKAEEVANKVIKNSSFAIGHGLEAMNQSTQIKLKDGLEIEALMFAKLFGHPDQREGMGAFLEKRKADFK